MGKQKSLVDAVETRDQSEVLHAAQMDMAHRLELIDSGRDYAAIMKSLIDVTEQLVAMESKEASAKRPANRIAQAKAKQLRVVGE